MVIFFKASLNRFLIVIVLVGAFNKEKALVGAFSSHGAKLCEVEASLTALTTAPL